MANINNLTTSNSYGNTNSLYGNRNILTGLASGLDTETMIQNSVYAYQQKILSLQQSQTKIQWKQDAYRDIIDQMNSILQKYTSYTSKTNLASNAFFSNARKTETLGKYADAISASGVAKSDIQIDAVTQLATAARYTVNASALGVNAVDKAAGNAIDWSKMHESGQVKGTMTLSYGTQTIELKFDESDTDINTPEGLAAAINKKLADVTIKAKDGGHVKASTLINVKLDENAGGSGSTFRFEVNSKNPDGTKNADWDGSAVYISGLSGNVGSMLGAKKASSSAASDRFDYNSFTVSNTENLVKTQTTAEYLEGKTVSITLDGVTKTVTIGDLLSKVDMERPDFETLDATIKELQKKLTSLDENGMTEDGETEEDIKKQLEKAMTDRAEAATSYSGAMTKALKDDLQASINKAFGSGKIDVTVGENGGLSFDVQPNSGSMLSISSGAGSVLGIGVNGVSNYFSTTSTLTNLLTTDWLDKNARVKASGDSADFTTKTDSDGNTRYYDTDGNLVALDKDGEWYRVDENGNDIYSLVINGKQVGAFTKDTTLETVISTINSNTEVGVKVGYSNLTGQFVFTASETGEGGAISFDNALAQKLFCAKDSTSGGKVEGDGEMTGVTYTKGQDAVVHATVNGTSLTLKRSSNVIEMDGMTVTLNKTFNVDEDGKKIEGGEAVRFKTTSDSDGVVDALKSFVEDINTLLKSIHDAYSTMPLKNSSSSSSSGYEPLTEEDKASMSESAIKAYEEKAKTGILFGDTDLSQLYNRILNAIQASGADRMDLEFLGLKTTYSNGLTQLTLDEDKLRAALDSDPDRVRNAFTKTAGSGSKTNGLIASLKAPLNTYGSTSIGSPGILVSKAGTKLSAVSLMNNNLQKQIDNLDKQIEKWQSKLSSKVDSYTRQFSLLEQLMSTMNNQSSMLASLMGGY